MSTFDDLVEKAARAIEGDVEYVVPKRDGSPLTVAHVRLTRDEALEVARAAISAINLPTLLERLEAAEHRHTDDCVSSDQADRFLRQRDTLAAKVADLAGAYQAKHDRVCKDTEDSLPMSKRHAHDCGVTAQDVAADLRATLDASETPRWAR